MNMMRTFAALGKTVVYVSGDLRRSPIVQTYGIRFEGEDTVGIGSPMVYAGTFNFGAKSGEFGFGMYATRQGSFPIPWGNIPARRFLGLSAADKVNVADLIRSYMLEG